LRKQRANGGPLPSSAYAKLELGTKMLTSIRVLPNGMMLALPCSNRREFTMRRWTAVVLSLGLLTCCCVVPTCRAQDPKPPAGIAFHRNLEYGTGGGETLKLDLALPEKKSDKPLPVVVMIHGGGWARGNKDGHIQQIFGFAQQGYAAANVQYRFAPKHKFPAQVEDVKCAVRYLRANAETYNLNKDRIGAIGFSAGAHLSMLLGTMDKDDGLEGDGGNADQSSKVQAVVAYFGPTDLSADDYPANVVALIDDLVGAKVGEKPELRKAASPVTYVSAGDAPTLIYQGTKDRLVPHSQAYKMADALTKAGVPGRVELLLGADHGWAGKELQHTVAGTTAFFAEHLKK
jgi:acetyl esterase/lipase